MSSLTYSNAPLATIDIKALKSSRFLLPEQRQLPFRDDSGAVNLPLTAESKRQLEAGEVPGVTDEVASKLHKWYKNAQYQTKQKPVRWERRALPGGGANWHSSSGEKRREVHSHSAARSSAELPVLAEAAPNVQREAKQPRKHDGPGAVSSGACLPDQRKQRLQAMAALARQNGKPKKAKRERDDAETAAAAAAAEEALAEEKRRRKLRKEAAREEASRQEQTQRADEKRRARQVNVSDSEEEAMEKNDDDDDDGSDSGADEAAEAAAGEEALDQVLGKCDQVASKMRNELSLLLRQQGKHGASTLPQPSLLHSSLTMTPHQLVGLSWLHGLHKHGASGILADDMGLGKVSAGRRIGTSRIESSRMVLWGSKKAAPCCSFDGALSISSTHVPCDAKGLR